MRGCKGAWGCSVTCGGVGCLLLMGMHVDVLCAFKAWVNVELTTYVATFMTYSNV